MTIPIEARIDRLKTERDDLQNRLAVVAAVIDKIMIQLWELRDFLPNEEVRSVYVEEIIQELVVQLTALRDRAMER